MKTIEKVKSFIKKIVHLLIQPDMLVLPGQLAFFLLLAIVPTITLIAYGAGLFHISFDFLTQFLVKSFGISMAELIMPIINDIKFTPGFLIPLFVAIYAASGGASSIIITSNQLYHTENTSFLKRKIKGLFMITILVTLVVFLLLIPGLGDKFIALIRFVNLNEAVTNTLVFVINLSKGPISWLLIFFLIKIIYTLAPDVHIPSRYTTKGSLFTTIGFIVVTFGYSIFVNHIANYDLLYGGLSHFVVLMIWLYLVSYCVTIGIAINASEYEKRKKLEL